MFVVSVKTTGRRLCAAVATVALALSVLALALFLPKTGTAAAVAAVTADDQQHFLRSLGYATNGAPLSTEEVRLPDNPRDSSFVAYNALQLEAGFNLLLYGGKTVKRTAWSVKADDGAAYTAHLYVFKEKIVGGDLTDPKTGTQKALTKVSREE